MNWNRFLWQPLQGERCVRIDNFWKIKNFDENRCGWSGCKRAFHLARLQRGYSCGTVKEQKMKWILKVSYNFVTLMLLPRVNTLLFCWVVLVLLVRKQHLHGMPHQSWILIIWWLWTSSQTWGDVETKGSLMPFGRKWPLSTPLDQQGLVQGHWLLWHGHHQGWLPNIPGLGNFKNFGEKLDRTVRRRVYFSSDRVCCWDDPGIAGESTVKFACHFWCAKKSTRV